MGLEDFIGKAPEAEINPYDGEYDNGTLIVDSVTIELEGEEHIIELAEEVEWNEATKRAVGKLAQERLDQKRREEMLAPAEGGSKLSVGGDTKVFRTLLVIGYLQPVPTQVVGDVLGHDNPSSMIGNATYRKFVQAVAEKGNTHYYSLTPKGWKQIIAVHGAEDWRSAAEELLSSYTPSDSEDEEEQTGLSAFGYDKDGPVTE